MGAKYRVNTESIKVYDTNRSIVVGTLYEDWEVITELTTNDWLRIINCPKDKSFNDYYIHMEYLGQDSNNKAIYNLRYTGDIETESKNIVKEETNSQKYRVSAANVCVYESNSKDSERIGMLSEDEEVIFGTEYQGSWRKIYQCPSHASYKGKWIYMGINGDDLRYTGDIKGFNTVEYYKNTATERKSILEGDKTPKEQAIEDSENSSQNIDSGNIESTLSGGISSSDENYDSFTSEYNSYNISDRAYLRNLENGLTIRKIRGVLGIPHQFSYLTDIRIDENNLFANEYIGRTYAEKILRPMPLLLITPGIPKFMSAFNEDQKRSAITALFGNNRATTTISDILGEGNYSGKYYSLEFAYVDYFKYVNAMLRSAAVYLGIENEEVDGKLLNQFNWLYSNDDQKDWDTDLLETIWSNTGIGSFLGPYAGTIAIYADCGNQVNDSFTNHFK